MEKKLFPSEVLWLALAAGLCSGLILGGEAAALLPYSSVQPEAKVPYEAIVVGPVVYAGAFLLLALPVALLAGRLPRTTLVFLRNAFLWITVAGVFKYTGRFSTIAWTMLGLGITAIVHRVLERFRLDPTPLYKPVTFLLLVFVVLGAGFFPVWRVQDDAGIGASPGCASSISSYRCLRWSGLR